MKHNFQKFDKVKLLVDIKDSYGKICHLNGDIEQVKYFSKDGEGIIFDSNLGLHYTLVELVEKYKEKIFYKIRHKESGLFYKPSKHKDKSNLSKEGKVYCKKPSFNFVESYYHPDEVKENSRNPKVRKSKENDWEIIVYNFIEIERLNF